MAGDCTKLMVIRHAEKPDKQAGISGVTEAGMADKDELTVKGWQRAGALVRFFNPSVPARLGAGLAACWSSELARERGVEQHRIVADPDLKPVARPVFGIIGRRRNGSGRQILVADRRRFWLTNRQANAYSRADRAAAAGETEAPDAQADRGRRIV